MYGSLKTPPNVSEQRTICHFHISKRKKNEMRAQIFGRTCRLTTRWCVQKCVYARLARHWKGRSMQDHDTRYPHIHKRQLFCVIKICNFDLILCSACETFFKHFFHQTPNCQCHFILSQFHVGTVYRKGNRNRIWFIEHFWVIQK